MCVYRERNESGDSVENVGRGSGKRVERKKESVCGEKGEGEQEREKEREEEK